MPTPLRLLLIEDSEDDALLMLRELRRGGFAPESLRAQTESEVRQAIKRPWDLVVSDYNLRGFTGLEALPIIHEADPHLPVIIVSGTRGEEFVVEAMRAGARDFVTKDSLYRLSPAVRRELAEGEARREKRRLKAALEEQQKLFAAIVTHAPVGIVVLAGDDLRVRWANDFYRSFLEEPFRSRELSGVHLNEFLPRAEESGVTEIFRRVARTGEPYSTPEYEHAGFLRGTTWWRWSIFPLPASGPVPDLMLIASEISEQIRARREAEEERRRSRESEERLQAILDNSASAVYLKDTEGRYLLVNRVFTRIFGRPAEWFPGRTDAELFATCELAEAVRQNDSRVLESGMAMSFEETVLQDDGPHTFYATKFPLRNEEGKIFAVGGIATDITPLKKAEEKRERILAELDATIASIADGLIIYGVRGEILRLNPAAERMFNYTPEMRRQTPEKRTMWRTAETSDGDHLPAEEIPVVRALKGETVLGALLVMHPPSGGTVHVSVSAAPIRTADGRLLGAVATFSDITPLREIQKSQEMYTHTISHDLRTPLTVIQGHAQLLEEALKGKGGAGELFHTGAILQASVRMQVMIEDLVEAARLEGGELKLAKEPVDLEVFLSEFLRRSSTALDPQRLRLDISPKGPEIFADPMRLERVMNNLLTNALKYSPPHSPVFVRTRPEKDEMIVEVEDRGMGIVPEDLPHIFERFYLTRTGRKGGGVGLGLYIARMVVEAHGGTIRVESEPGKGTTFTLTLPLARGAKGKQENLKGADPWSRSSKPPGFR